ncbi:MAG: hypothetical protein JW714_03235 [Candidatus Omnitrophica bacterium]|nr:hypothetical protein [Candidatus Omnitrophota bacterium]
MKKRALLVIGHENVARGRRYVSFVRFVYYAQKFKRQDLELKIINYTQLLSGRIPRIRAHSITVVLFFPYQYWNRNIEVYRDGRIYGDNRFGREFQFFFTRVKKKLQKYYRGKQIEYLNSPEACILDRDKQATKDLLHKYLVPVPQSFFVSSFSGVNKLLKRGLSLYIKPRFGAMGKGISYINKKSLLSNFLIRRGKIISRNSDFNWGFIRIKNKKKFINRLLSRGFICEQAITPAVLNNRRFDFRIYVVFGRIVYLYAKSSPNHCLVTNWSQGGKIDRKKNFLNSLPKTKIELLNRLARKTARVLGLNFAGIDVIFSQDWKQAYVLEANAFPGYEKGFDLMRYLSNLLV